MASTPKQFAFLATKDDLKDLEDKMDVKLDKVLNAVDGVAKQLSDIKIELVSNIAAHDRLEERFVAVERGVDILEGKWTSKSCGSA